MAVKIEDPGPHLFPAVTQVGVDHDYGRDGVIIKVWTRIEGQLVSVDISLNNQQADGLEGTLTDYREQRQRRR